MVRLLITADILKEEASTTCNFLLTWTVVNVKDKRATKYHQPQEITVDGTNLKMVWPKSALAEINFPVVQNLLEQKEKSLAGLFHQRWHDKILCESAKGRLIYKQDRQAEYFESLTVEYFNSTYRVKYQPITTQMLEDVGLHLQ